MLITDWLFVDIKKLCDVFRYGNGVVFMFFLKSLNLLGISILHLNDLQIK